MAVQNGLSPAHLFVTAMRLAQRQAHAKKERGLWREKWIPHRAIGQRFNARYRQALFPAPGIVRKVIVACANVRLLKVVGAPAIGGSSSPAPSASMLPFSLTRSSSKLAASRR